METRWDLYYDTPQVINVINEKDVYVCVLVEFEIYDDYDDCWLNTWVFTMVFKEGQGVQTIDGGDCVDNMSVINEWMVENEIWFKKWLIVIFWGSVERCMR